MRELLIEIEKVGEQELRVKKQWIGDYTYAKLFRIYTNSRTAFEKLDRLKAIVKAWYDKELGCTKTVNM